MAVAGKLSILVLCVFHLQDSQEFKNLRAISGECVGATSECQAPQGVTLPEINGIKIRSCPKMEGMRNFQVERLSGVWYLQLKTYDQFEPHTRCSTAALRITDDANTQIDQKISIMSSLTGKFTQFHTPARVNTLDNTVYHDEELSPTGGCSSQIISTDYSNYMAWNGCINYNQGLFHRDHTVIYSRNVTLSKELLKTAKQALKVQGIDVSQLVGLGFEECPPGFDDYVKNDNN